MHSLYLLKFSSGKAYVGQTVRTMNLRLQQHRTAARRGSELPVHCAWRKYGEPEVQVLGEFATDEELHRAEIDAIARLGTLSPAGYNVSVGGDTAPSKNPEVAKKIAQKARGRKISDTSAISEGVRRNWQSPEYREKVSAGLRAAVTPELREAYKARNRAMWDKRRAEGWSMPEATKEKLRAKVVSDETRARMSASAKGKVLSDETKAKIGAASKGKKRGAYDPDRVAKAAAGVKAAWADPVKRALMMEKKRAAAQRREEKAMTGDTP